MEHALKKIFPVAASLLLILAASCNKAPTPSVDDDGLPKHGEPVIKPKGQPAGDAVVTSIGPAGGVLWFHGAIRLEVPPGAVDDPTTFGIQPITNTLDDASPFPAFRLTPEGTRFKKPIQVSFLYAPETAGHARTRTVAFQNHLGMWCGVSTALHADQQRLTIETMHFSDWAWFDHVSLRKDQESVGADATVNLKVMELVLAALTPTNHIDSVPLAAMDDIGFSKSFTVGGWKIVSGPGTIDPKINANLLRGDAVYTAPSVIHTATDVEIQVEVESKNGYITDPTAPNGRRKFGKLVLLTKIRLLPDQYLFVEVDGVRQNLSAGAAGAVMGGQITISSANEAGVAITLSCHGDTSGSYPGGIEPGTSFVLMSVPWGGAPRSFQNAYVACPEIHYSGTAEVSINDESIAGTFSGMVYYSDKACGFTQSKPVECTFKIKRH